MEIRDVHLASIAHFDEVQLDLGPGLHILYGPNETGKSTLLVALIDLLFGGLPSRREWYETGSRMRAQIIRGETAYELRRRRHRAQLVQTDADDKPVDDQFVLEWLRVERDRYMQMYGFDHDRLRSGGQSLLAAEGDVGISLFEAGSGISFVKRLMEGYRTRLNELYSPAMRNNSTAVLNRSLRTYQEAKTSGRNEMLRPTEWLSAETAVRETESEVAKLQDALEETQRQLTKAQRVVRNLPLIQARKQVTLQLDSLSHVTVLTEKQEDELVQSLQERRRLHSELAQEEDVLTGEQDKLKRMHVDEEILRHAGEVESLRDEFGMFRTAREEVAALQEELQRLEMDIAKQQETLLPPSLIREAGQKLVRITHDQREGLMVLSQQLRDMGQAKSLTVRDLAQVEADLEERRSRLSEGEDVPDISAVRERIQSWRSQGISSARADALRQKCLMRKRDIEETYGGQSMWGGPLEEILSLRLPLSESIQRYVDRTHELTLRVKECERELTQIEAELERCERAYETLEASGNVPDEQELAKSRRHRDEGWNLVRHRLGNPTVVTLEAAAYAAEAGTLEDAYELAVEEADELADRLRREADRVATKAELVVQIGRAKASRERIGETLKVLQSEQQTLSDHWQREWQHSGIEPKTPDEMQAWVQQWVQPVRRALLEVRDMENEWQAAQALVEEADAALSNWADLVQLKIPAKLKTFDERLAFVEMSVTQFEKERLERRTIIDAIAEAERKQKRLSSQLSREELALQSLHKDYEALRETIDHLPASLAAVPSYLDAYDALCDAMDEVGRKGQTVGRKRSFIQQFEEKVQRVAKAVGTGTDGESEYAGEDDVMALYSDLQARFVRAVEVRQAFLQQQRITEEQQKRVAKMKQTIQQVEAFVEHWMNELQVTDESALLSQIHQSRERRTLVSELQQIEQTLLSTGDGFNLSQLLREASEEQDIDGLPAKVEQLTGRVREIEGFLRDRHVKLGEQKQVLAQMDGSQTQAAEAAQHAAIAADEVQAAWEEVVRLQASLTLLEETMNVYRDRNQNGMIQSAGELFRRMTVERYTGIDLDDDPSAPRLLAVHHDGGRRTFAELSDGTIDQLHFSLRLAFLLAQAREGDSLPLMMDDVFVHFDDDRTQSALKILDELAEDMQILYFTHHRHLVERVLPQAETRHAKVHDLEQLIRYR
ncbi:AAA family ATPase [Alicyclobacillus dauci]|uniref:AAA family ATPase n=1 Tax=Alicyclobacillus dauci TaxID=1475485 RepID=A0ABY6Z3E3_9BACL|nr:AAA family ATPase [Alicyclobacillus dauci]WAH37269.1 AAA family ATPase [Alicyclobacillus dauci]